MQGPMQLFLVFFWLWNLDQVKCSENVSIWIGKVHGNWVWVLLTAQAIIVSSSIYYISRVSLSLAHTRTPHTIEINWMWTTIKTHNSKSHYRKLTLISINMSNCAADKMAMRLLYNYAGNRKPFFIKWTATTTATSITKSDEIFCVSSFEIYSFHIALSRLKVVFFCFRSSVGIN